LTATLKNISPAITQADSPEKINLTRTRDEIRGAISTLVAEYYRVAFSPSADFRPGQDSVPVSGKVFDADELQLLVESGLDFWLTSGRFAKQFEKEFARWWGLRECLLVNSGSSANLVALSALTSPSLGSRRLQAGDEVVTVAAGFPTTINPIWQNQLVPVFVDVRLPTYDPSVEVIASAIGPRTRAVMIAHALGNPFDAARIAELCRRHSLWFIEDCCDAAGGTIGGQAVGTFGDIATCSFYPAHHITMGEGGAVLTNQPKMRTLLESFRDWGRDCWCEPGKDNTCGKRYSWDLGDLPHGYDHKYTYSHVGYNLKATDMQAAVGVAQLKKLPFFIQRRRENWRYLRSALAPLEDVLVLPEPSPNSDPSWFGFVCTVATDAPKTRDEVVRFLESRGIGTRLFFGGNLLRQPAYRGLEYRVVGSLDVSDRIMRDTFWVGVYPGLDKSRLDWIVRSLFEVFGRRAE
jgi:CDP-4-dehydro-6-deoxyglucose reductase, E1